MFDEVHKKEFNLNIFYLENSIQATQQHFWDEIKIDHT